MSRFPGVKRILHFALGRRGLEREIDEEIAFHLESTVAELEAAGMSGAKARAEAERRFGNLPEYRTALTRLGEQRRDGEQRREYLDILRQHLTYAWRGIVKRPGLALTIALTLALGIGANAVMFGVIDRLLFRAPDLIDHPEQLRRLFVTRDRPDNARPTAVLSFSEAMDLTRVHGIGEIALYHYHNITFGEGSSARRVPVEMVSPSLFPVLGVQPMLGRGFSSADDSASLDNATVILGYELWTTEFHQDPGILGRTVLFGDHRFVVIGVAPRGFTGAELYPVDAWFPLTPGTYLVYPPGYEWKSDRTNWWVRTVMRIPTGAPDVGLISEMAALHLAGSPDTSVTYRWRHLSLAPLIAAHSPDRSSDVPVAFWLAGTSLIVLLIACANVATLLLARAVQRRREIAVRLALGIGRRRLVVHLLVESICLALAGGILALVVTWWGTGLLRTFLLPQVAWPSSALDVRIVSFILVISIGCGALAGIVPAWLEARPDLLQSLKSGGSGSGFRRSRVQGGLVLAQAAMSVCLLVAAGLFIRSLARVRGIDLGLSADQVLIVYPRFLDGISQMRQAELVGRARTIVSRVPGVERAALSSAIPLEVINIRRVTGINGDSLVFPPLSGPYSNDVSPDYFATIGTPLLRGRLFDAADAGLRGHVVIISQNMAAFLYPNRDPIGQCFRVPPLSSDCLTVVGVVGDAHWFAILEGPTFTFYEPLATDSTAMYQYLSIRVRGDPHAAIPAIKAAVLAALPGTHSVEVVSLQDHLNPEFRPWRLGATLFLVFGALALVVAAIGLYSVMACRVAQRKHELGVRTALGASWQDLIQMVVREGVGLVSGGIVIGLLIALAAAPAVAPLLYHTSPRDPEVMLVVTGVLLLSAVVACAIPAFRASRVDPMEALKAD